MIITYSIKKGINKDKCDDSALIGSKVVSDVSGVVDENCIDRVCIGDGVGGNAGGDEAASFVMHQLMNIAFCDSDEEMRKELLLINEKLLEFSSTIAGHEAMATTITGLFFQNEKVKLAHCGNTRMYALQGSFLKQITSDQTTYQWLLSTGKFEAAEHCNKSEIKGAFGGENAKFADTLIVETVFQRGIPKRILLTSDGIHDLLDIDQIEDIVTNDSLTSQEKTDKLIEEAVSKGSQDDCTAVLIEYC